MFDKFTALDWIMLAVIIGAIAGPNPFTSAVTGFFTFIIIALIVMYVGGSIIVFIGNLLGDENDDTIIDVTDKQ